MTRTREYANEINRMHEELERLLEETESKFKILKDMVPLKNPNVDINFDEFEFTKVNLSDISTSNVEPLKGLINALKHDIGHILLKVVITVLGRDVSLDENCRSRITEEFIDNFNSNMKYFENYKKLIGSINDEEMIVWVREYVNKCLSANDCELLELLLTGDVLSNLDVALKSVHNFSNEVKFMGIKSDWVSNCVLRSIVSVCGNPSGISNKLNEAKDKLDLIHVLKKLSDEIGTIGINEQSMSLIRDLVNNIQDIRNSIHEAWDKLNKISDQGGGCLFNIDEVYDELHQNIESKIEAMKSTINALNRLLNYISNVMNLPKDYESNINRINECIEKVDGLFSDLVKDNKVVVDKCSGLAYFMKELERVTNNNISKFKDVGDVGDRELSVLQRLLTKFSGEVDFKTLSDELKEDLEVVIGLCRKGVLPCMVKL